MKTYIKDRWLCKGYLSWEYRWFSICSKHFVHNKDCTLCQCGHFVHWWWYKITYPFSKVYYKLYRKYKGYE